MINDLADCKITSLPRTQETPPMIDIREMIRCAEQLQAKGLKIRAGEMWRRIANHPETPDDVRAAYWRCVEAENKWQTVNTSRDETTSTRNQSRIDAAQVKAEQAREMYKAGASRQQIAKALGVSLSRIYAYLPTPQKAAH